MFATLACSPAPDEQQPAAEVSPAPAEQRDARGAILFLGTSLTAGYGIGAENAFPAVIQQKLDSAGYPMRVINAGLSGETSAGGLRRLEWSLQSPVDILVLELGANDGLRGQSVDALRANLDTIMTRTRRRYPDAGIVLAGMEAPPNLGAEYTAGFRQTFADLAQKHNAALIPFLLDGVAADPALNQEDRIHPNVDGHRRIAQTVWRVLQPMVQKFSAEWAPATRE
jgi:acyl-CoA thioesterase-1